MTDYLDSTDLLFHLKCNYEQMSAVEKKISDFFLANLNQVPDKTVTEISLLCDVSEASIIRFVKKLGYAGFYQMKIELARTVNMNSLSDEHAGDPGNIREVVEKSLSIAVENLKNTYENIPIPDLEKAVEILTSCRSVYFFAAGNSLPLCHDFKYRLGRLGIKGSVSDVSEVALLNAQIMEQGDIAFAISHSGDSLLVNKALELVKTKNLPVICITNHRRSPVIKWTDLALVTSVQHNLFRDSGNYTRLTESGILDLLFYLIFYRKREFYEQHLSQTEIEQSLYSL